MFSLKWAIRSVPKVSQNTLIIIDFDRKHALTPASPYDEVLQPFKF